MIEKMEKTWFDGKEKLRLEWDSEPWCEHCGPELEPFDIVWVDEGGVWWCTDCALTNGLKLTKEEYTEIKITEIKKKLEHFGFRIASLQEELETFESKTL